MTEPTERPWTHIDGDVYDDEDNVVAGCRSVEVAAEIVTAVNTHERMKNLAQRVADNHGTCSCLPDEGYLCVGCEARALLEEME